MSQGIGANGLPLAGISVIDMTEVWAGPMATSLLADLGATVYRVESFPRTSTTRPLGASARTLNFSHGNDVSRPRPWERSARYHMVNRNKLGLAINLKEADGVEIIRRLARHCDVVVDGYSSGTLARLGVGYETLSALNRRLIYVGIPGWGSQGPFASYVTNGDGMDASVGMMLLRGYPGTDPTMTNDAYQADAVTPLMVVLAVNLALAQRAATGRGQKVEIAQAEALITQFPGPFMEYSLTGVLPRQLGNGHPDHVPYGCYRCVGDDAWVVITVTEDEQWERLVAFDELAVLRDVGTSLAERRRHRARIDQALAAWAATSHPADLAERLQQCGIPAFPVLNDAAALSDPHLRQRGFFEEVEHPFVGRVRLTGPLWRLHGVPRERKRANLLGEHNHEVLTRLLGYTTDEVAALRERQVIGDSDALECMVGAGEPQGE